MIGGFGTTGQTGGGLFGGNQNTSLFGGGGTATSNASTGLFGGSSGKFVYNEQIYAFYMVSFLYAEKIYAFRGRCKKIFIRMVDKSLFLYCGFFIN